MKNLFKITFALFAIAGAVLFNCLIGGALGAAVEHPFAGMAIANAIGIGQNIARMYASYAHVSYSSPSILLNGLNQEVWIDDLLLQLRADISLLEDGIDMTAWVQNNQINLAAEGDDPDVVIDDTSVLTPSSRSDSALTVPLNTFRTRPTIVTDMEEAELAYDKMSSINRQHVLAINQKLAKFTAFNWAPAAATAATPVVLATGSADAIDGLKIIKSADIAALSRQADALNWPQTGRTLVLDAASFWGLVDNDPKLTQQMGYLARAIGDVPGVLTNYYGWNIRMYNSTPTYRLTGGVWTRNAFGSTPVSGTDFKGGIAYVAKQNIVKAYGTMKQFAFLNEPTAQADIVSYRVRATGKKKKEYMVAAILRTS